MSFVYTVKDFGYTVEKIVNTGNEKLVLDAKKTIELAGKESKYCKILFHGSMENAGGYISINNIYDIPLNSEMLIPIITPQLINVQLVISAESSLTLDELIIEEIAVEDSVIDSGRDSDVLVVVPNYPSSVNLYYCAFAHARNIEYKKAGIKFDVASITESNTFEMHYNIDGISVIAGNYQTLKTVLSTRKYKVIVTHFVDEYLFSVFDGYTYPNNKLIFICHGPETIYRYLLNVTRPYFTKQIPEYQYENLFSLKDKFVKKYAEKDNVEWVFVSQWLKNFSETQQNVTFKHSRVINNIISTERFPYKKKDADKRKKILVIRKFDNIIQHSIDQVVMSILELSEREFFEDLEFDIYGDGKYYDILVEPIRKFRNVHFHRRFVPNELISEIHEEHGILLIPSRHDAHAVAMGEGASSGLVVVGSNVTSNPFFMQQERFHTLADPENPKELADIIERLYKNPEEFLEISEKLSEFTRSNFGKEKTVYKEIELIKDNIQNNKKQVVELDKCKVDYPLLSIVVPAYNVEKYIEKCLVSLLNHRNSYKTEIIVVNDGSTDNTLAIAKEFERLSNGIVKVIDKNNGGHGSAINVGIKEATGKYFRLIDGDDWVDGGQLALLVDKLENEVADIVLTKGAYEYVEKGCLENIIDYDMLNEGQLYKFDDLVYPGYGFVTYGPLLTTTNIKTELLRKANFKITEKKPYVDMEFNSFSLKYVNTIKFYDLDIYRYLIGRQGQTISREAWKRKYKDHAQIIFNIVRNVYGNKQFSEGKRRYIFEHIIAQMADSQIFMYDVALAWNEIDGFLDELRKYPEVYDSAISYIENKKGNCQLILRKYKEHQGNDPIIIPGIYETLEDDAKFNYKNVKHDLKYYVKRGIKCCLPYGILKLIWKKNGGR